MRLGLRYLLCVAIALLVLQAPYSESATINVPADQPTIQAGINAAVSGADEVVVAPGIYNETVVFLGKAITVRSASGNPHDTIIDGTGNFHVVRCVNGETSTTELRGFTITGGNANGSDPVMSIETNGFVGLGVSEPQDWLVLPNVADQSGRGRANAWLTYSSRRHKQNIEPIDDALAKVEDLSGVRFDWNPEQGGGQDTGFIAEEVAAVLPELVVWEPDGKNVAGLKYDRITALSI